MSVAAPAEALIPGRALAWLTVAIVLVVAPHTPRLPPWITTMFVLFALWRVLAPRHGWPLPDARHPWLQNGKRLVAVAVFAAVYVTFGGNLGREAGVALLVVLLGLKLLEARLERDFYVTAFLGYFLVVTNFLYSQSMVTAVYMFGTVIVTTATLVAMNDPGSRLGVRRRLVVAATLLAQAVPLMLVLFVLFPRLPGPLWGLPRDARAGVTGLDDEMTPGNISELSLSDEVAFRVDFQGSRPPPAALYWRGPVLWHTDGRTWTPGRPSPEEADPVPVLARGSPVRYTVTLEPHDQPWIYALDLPTEIPQVARQARDLRLLTRRPVQRRLRYAAVSDLDYRVVDAGPGELTRALRLPAGRHPQAVALGQRWRLESRQPARIVRRALDHFRDENFAYTLRPPLAGEDPVDEFLFGSRRGFCEHFAAGFTVLMRAAGVPARIVTGYQGGEYNPVGDYLVVRQRDAHAWTEVWLGVDGWVRVDPTAAVSPARVELGIDDVLPVSAGLLPGIEGNAALVRAWRGLADAWDAANNAWNQWVLGYNAQRQAQLLSRFGLRPDWARLGLWLTIAIGVLLAAIGAGMLYAWRTRLDPVRRQYERYCAALARAGCRREPWEGPLDFGARAARARGDLAPAIAAVTDLYVRARYLEERAALPGLREAVRALRKAAARRPEAA